MNMLVIVSGLELRGAYGRPTAMSDWYDGKDFKIVGGPYCSICDVDEIAKEFDTIEFISHDGNLVERIVLNKNIEALELANAGEFLRI